MLSLRLIIGVLFLNGCANLLKSPEFFNQIVPTDAYTRTFYKMTQHKQILSSFDPVLSAYITFWNQRLREAYVKEKSRHFRLTEPIQKQLIAEVEEEGRSYYVFIMSVATAESSLNQFEKRNSLWRLTLENDEGSIQIEPENIEVISQKDEQAHYFYKTMNVFSRTYRLRFAKQPFVSAPELIFYMTGPHGSLKHRFKLSDKD